MSVSLDGQYAGLHDHRVRTVAVFVSFWAWCALLSFPMIGLDMDLAEVSFTFTLSATALRRPHPPAAMGWTLRRDGGG